MSAEDLCSPGPPAQLVRRLMVVCMVQKEWTRRKAGRGETEAPFVNLFVASFPANLFKYFRFLRSSFSLRDMEKVRYCVVAKIWQMFSCSTRLRTMECEEEWKEEEEK